MLSQSCDLITLRWQAWGKFANIWRKLPNFEITGLRGEEWWWHPAYWTADHPTYKHEQEKKLKKIKINRQAKDTAYYQPRIKFSLLPGARIFCCFMGWETWGDLWSVQDFACASIFTDQNLSDLLWQWRDEDLVGSVHVFCEARWGRAGTGVQYTHKHCCGWRWGEGVSYKLGRVSPLLKRQ